MLSFEQHGSGLLANCFTNCQHARGYRRWLLICDLIVINHCFFFELLTYDRSWISFTILCDWHSGISWFFMVFHDISKFLYYHSLTRPAKTVHPEGYSLNATECKINKMWSSSSIECDECGTNKRYLLTQRMLIKYIKVKSQPQPDQKTSFVFQQHGTIDGDITHRNSTGTLGQFRYQPPFFGVRVLPRKKQQSHMPSPVTCRNGDRIYVGHAWTLGRTIMWLAALNS